ncbi:MAG: selenide, water dikinase SelD [Pseudomonadota bacterium]|jgi:selenide,water dikinase
MQSNEQPILRDIVLIGGGHSHVGVLRRFGMQPEPGVRLTVICNTVETPYSGMLPGYIAGHYSFEDVHIDLPRLAALAGARFYHDEVIGIDRASNKVLCRERPPVSFDLCSINVGSTPQMARVPGAAQYAVPVKPIPGFHDRWLALLARVRLHPGRTTIALVGGGAGGVELTLAMQHRLRTELQTLGRNPDELVFHLYTRDQTIMRTHNRWVQARFKRVLADRGVHLHTSAEVQQVRAGQLIASDGSVLQTDEIVWVTQAGGPAWLQSTGLALDAEGFVRVNPQLQSSDPRIFAAGDVCAFDDRPLEKAGVFAVRMGRPLADNLRRAARGERLREYVPQRHWLALISTGDQHAVASRGALGFAGDWVWRWKDWIDRRFMQRFHQFQAMPMAGGGAAPQLALTAEESQQAISAIAMRCGGCGAKVGATVLARALGALQPVARDDVLIGLHAPDDAAVVRVPPGMAMVHTVDFFRAFIDDPYLFGQVAANHALGDIFAMGAEPQSATAVVTVPPGLESKVEDLLLQMMSGAMEVLNAANCALVGGHTGEGKELALGFAVNGLIDGSMRTVLRKDGLRPGQVLLLTKPIGTGTLFAAHARIADLPGFKGRWVTQALQSMVQSNQAGARILLAHGATACTDLTGFGLLGHLVEMTKPSGVDAELDLSALPVLQGAEYCVSAGVASSLAPANVRLRRALRNQADYVSHPRYPLLFDPQTAGGLLASVPSDQAEACVVALRAAGYPHTAIIGRILPAGEALEPVLLRN